MTDAAMHVRLLIGVLLILVCSCNKESHLLSTTIGKKMELSSLSPTYNGRTISKRVSFSPLKARMVIFLDSTQCNQCHLKHFSDYSDFMDIEDANNNFDLLYVLSPSKAEKEHILHDLFILHLNDVVYLDEENLFQKKNPYIPKGQKYHVFLLDENMKVILMGDPMISPKMRDLYLNTILRTTIEEE